MRYFQISNGTPGCLWDSSFAVLCSSIADLAEALLDHYNDVAALDYTEDEATGMTYDEALGWARAAWHTKGCLPISVNVGPSSGNYCVACVHCTAAEAHEINEAML